ncbi:unnamed protein product [Fraxinus pennsylvanica]|uniref:Transmembrane protein n=1 Tax=Fraxinus pennsylvanica TaxID=56036 RepID=A0AAD1ZJS2_9LAMI|nr:unnamed protein product [Fraxinus pennsylvanica]
MAVTHADLAPSRRRSDLGSKTGAFLMVFSILLGLVSFILCLISEASRSQMIWEASSGEGKVIKSECTYSSSGKIPLLFATGAFFALAMAMVIQHTYLLVALSKSDSLLAITWDPDSDVAKSLTWQAGFFFVTTWVCFAVGEILLLIGLSVESGHLKNWQMPRESCLIIREGLFTAAGVFGLLTVFLASGLYITALRAQLHTQDQVNTHRELLEASVLYASPPRSPRRTIRAVPNENPTARQDQNLHTLNDYLTAFDKHSNLV